MNTAASDRDINANLGTGLPGKSNIVPLTFVSECDKTTVITQDMVTAQNSLFFKDCKNCEYEIHGYSAKIMIQNCSNSNFRIKGKVITSTTEIWRCEKVTTTFSTPMKTIQVDLSTNVQVHFDAKVDFQSMIWAGCHDLFLGYGDFSVTESDEFHHQGRLLMGMEPLKTVYPNLDENIDQFIVRFVREKLLVERIVRLDNGFPSTEREARAFDERQETALRQLAESMGINLKKKNQVTVGRNDPCVCGSVRKYKKCCGAK